MWAKKKVVSMVHLKAGHSVDLVVVAMAELLVGQRATQ